jgi:hypothetical protein
MLAQQSELETGIRSRAFRRAARNAFLWPEEVFDLIAQNRSLSELRGIGPFIETQIRQWIEKPRRAKTVPAVRRDFLSLAEARRVLAARSAWTKKLRGDLQMHRRWSDGSGTVAEMADAAANRSYEYIAITDHSKTLKIAGGIDELALKRQEVEIAKINATLSKSAAGVTMLRSIDMNLNPRGEGDMRRPRCDLWILLSAPSIRLYVRPMIKPNVISLHCAIHTFTSSVTHAVVFTIFGSG